MALPRLQENVNNNDSVLLLHRTILEFHFEDALMQIRTQPPSVLTSLHNNVSALHLAANHGWLDGVQFLIEQRGVDINLVNLSHESALHHALRNSHWAVADYLVKQGANLELCDTQGIGLLSIIASQPANLPALQNLWKQCGASVQKRLLENRNALGKTPLHIAAMQGSLELVQWFVEELQKNHCPAPYTLVDGAGYTPLHEAAQYGHVAVCDYLIALGADPYVLNINGDAPIHLASLNNVAVSLHQKMRVAFPVFEEEVKDDVPQQNSRLWSEEHYRLLRNSLLEKAAIEADKLQDTQPDDPAMALVLWINSESLLENADQLARTCIRPNARVPEDVRNRQENIVANTVRNYTSAMMYALAALCHYEKHTPKQYQTTMGQQVLTAQAQRVLTHYRQKMMRRANACNAFEMPPLSQYRLYIKTHRENLTKALSNPAITTETVLQTNTEFFTTLINKLITHPVNLLGVPPCDYAFLAMGSLGRGEMCPYSDFEYAILLPEDKIQQRGYFEQLSTLLHLLVTGLGEVPCPVLADGYSPTLKGFSLDVDMGGLTPIMNPGLINTANKLAHYQTSDDAILRNALRDVRFLIGKNGEALYKAYQQAFTLIVDKNEGSWWTPLYTRQSLALAEMPYDLTTFASTTHAAKKEKKETALSFEVKAELYRLPQRAIAHLALYYGLQHTSGNSWTRVRALQQAKKISAAVSDKWIFVLETVLRLRLQTQLHYGSEDETLYTPESEISLSRFSAPPYRITENLRHELLSIYQVLCPLEQALHSFLNTGGTKNPFIEKDALNKTAHSQLDQAMVYERMNEAENARRLYRQAAQLHPTDLTIHLYRLRFEESQRSLLEQNVDVAIRSGHQWVKQLLASLREQHCGSGYYMDVYAQLPALWHSVFKTILEETNDALSKDVLTRLDAEDPAQVAFSPYFHQQLTAYPASAHALGLLSAADWQFINDQGRKITEEEKRWLQLGGQVVLNTLKKILQKSSQQRRETLLKALKLAFKNYKQYLHTALLKQTEHSLVLHCALQLLAETHAERILPALHAQAGIVEACLSTFVTLLLKEKRRPQDYLEYYRPLNVYLRQCLRTQLVRYQEKDNEHYAFLESVLQTLNACPDEGGERALLTDAKKKWEQQLSSLALDAEEAKEAKEEKEEEIITLTIPTVNRGQPFRLSQAIRNELLTEAPEYAFKPSNVESGNHKVRRLVYGSHVFYVKADPEMPGMTYLIDQLHQRMIGHGTCLSTIARLNIQGKEPREPLALQISESIPGDTLHTVLHHFPERLSRLDHQKFCELAFLAMLTNPEDGLPSNYIVTPVDPAADPANAPLYTLISVDHDHALFPAYLYDETTKPNGYRLQVKTILFCFPEMQNLIHPKARDTLLRIDALALLRQFLQLAQKENMQYARLFDASMMEKWHARRKGGSTTIPIPFKTGDAIQLYNKLLRLQNFLRVGTPITLMDCLSHLEPRVAMDYRQAFQNYPDRPVIAAVAAADEPEEHPIQARLKSLGHYPVNTKGELKTRTEARQTILLNSTLLKQPAYKQLADLKPEESLSELDKMAYQASTLKEIAQQLQSLDHAEAGLIAFGLLITPEHKSAIINGDEALVLQPLAWGKLSPLHQKTLLSLLQKNLPQDKNQAAQSASIYNFGLQKLQLRSCAPEALTLRTLMSILKQCPDLIDLDLSSLPQLDETWVSTIFNALHHLQTLTLKHCLNLESITLKKPLNHCKALNLEGTPIQEIVINAPALKYLRLNQCKQLKEVETQSRQLEVLDIRDCGQLAVTGLFGLVSDEYIAALNHLNWKCQGSRLFLDYTSQFLEQAHEDVVVADVNEVESKEADFRVSGNWQPNFFVKARADVACLLRLVAEGEQDKAEAMLKVNPTLALATGTVTDLSERTFKRITAFQYALWALDWHMWKMILKYLPREEATLQLQALEKNGTAYGKQFDLSHLINALETYTKNYNDWSYEQCKTHWCKKVGGVQRLLPTHIVNEYCRPDRPFGSVPDFTQGGLPRVRTVYANKPDDEWFSVEYEGGKIGESFAVWQCKCHRARACNAGVLYILSFASGSGFGILPPANDKEGVQSLWNTRKLQLQSLKTDLLKNKFVARNGNNNI